MALRDVVVRCFGESVAQKIERFVEGTIFGDEFVTCPTCGRPVASAYICERQVCPVCSVAAGHDTLITALEARRRAALAASQTAIREAAEIERELSARRSKA